MNKNLLIPAVFLLVSPLSHADFALSVSGGQADYELVVAEEPDYTETVDGDFVYRDITLDYTTGSHQFGVKLGGLAQESDVISATESFTAAEGVLGVATDTGDLERDEWSLFYTYRLDQWAFTAGYYSGESSLDRNFVVEYDYEGIGTRTQAQVAKKTIDNSGLFAGVAYGFMITERMGGFVRAGYQLSSVDETIDLAATDTLSGNLVFESGLQTDEFAAIRNMDTDGSATVLGAGVFYGINENWSATLYIDQKSFNYDSGEYTWSDGYGEPTPVKLDEEQQTIGLTLRYAF
jgi:hypothetical protein